MGRRQERRKRKQRLRRKRSLFGLCVLAVLCAGYLLACTMVDKNTIVDRVQVNGAEVGGLTAEQAAERIRKDFEEGYADAVLTVSANGEEYQVEMYPSLSLDAEAAAKKAMAYGHGSFLSRGADLLKAKLFGESITENPTVGDEEKLSAAIDATGLSAINTTVQTTYEVTGDTLLIHKGKTGVSVDKESLTADIRKAVSENDFATVIESPMLTGQVAATDMQAIYDKIHAKKSNATLDPKNDYKIVKSVTGISFDVNSAKTTFDAAEEGTDVSIPLTVKKPKITTKKLKKHLFKDKLGSCTTSVGGSSARISNVNLAAETLNGIVLLPGETRWARERRTEAIRRLRPTPTGNPYRKWAAVSVRYPPPSTRRRFCRTLRSWNTTTILMCLPTSASAWTLRYPGVDRTISSKIIQTIRSRSSPIIPADR